MQYRTTFLRAFLALVCGGLVGGNLSMILLVAGFGPPEDGKLLQFWQDMVIFWVVGVFVFGAIPFVLFHLTNVRQWYALTILGGLIMVTLSFVTFKGLQGGGGIFVLALLGGFVGWIIWRIAYQRQPGMDDLL